MNKKQREHLENMLIEISEASRQRGIFQAQANARAAVASSSAACALKNAILAFVEMLSPEVHEGLRRCEINRFVKNPIQGWFHEWIGTTERPSGLVEQHNGTMLCCPYEAIQFTDTDEAGDK